MRNSKFKVNSIKILITRFHHKKFISMDFGETEDNSQIPTSKSLGFLTKLEDFLGHDLKFLEHFV